MRIMSVVGARPQFVKLAPVAAALSAEGFEHLIVHTGQHYDAGMSAIFFSGLAIPEPDTHLGVGSGPHGAQTGAMLAALESTILRDRPDCVLVYGDTNSTIAAALAAVKLHVPVAHLEAGLRSFNRRMPEEHNRILTDHASDLLLAPTKAAMRQLADEGLADRSVLIGDVMTDICYRVRDAVLDKPLPMPEGIERGGYVVSTVHRAENTDDETRLRSIVTALSTLPAPVLLIAHPRLVARATEFGIDLALGSIRPSDPLGYPEMVSLVVNSAGVVTDSGGLQKEAYLLGRPCTTLRSETEWVETLDDGWNILDHDLSKLQSVAVRDVPDVPRNSPYGTGDAAMLLAQVLKDRVGMPALLT
jgi:UDP-N-acetylglucosamine 2-epimerase (non-hydrolysing)